MSRPIDPLNDTDPQSPRARVGSADTTDPIGGPIVKRPAPTPTPATAAVDELLEGVTGPRPPPSSRRRPGLTTPTPPSMRAYAPARPPPPSSPPPQFEARVIESPLPPIEPGMRAPIDPSLLPRDPGSVRPIVRRAEERTVYTGRRALVRNGSVVLASAAVVATLLFAAIRWTDARHHAPSSSAATQPAPPPAPPPAEPAVAPTPVQTIAPYVAPPSASAAARVPVRRLGAPVRRIHIVPTAVPSASSSSGSLDDLNQTIRH